MGKKCKIYLGFTSNMISTGIRETITFLVKNKLVDVLVTTCGGIEEDVMKCYMDTFVGKFKNDDKKLRLNGINRTGNTYVPNDNYTSFQDIFTKILQEMISESQEKNQYFSTF